MSTSDGTVEYGRIINSCRLELETAGNPSYVVVILEADGQVHLSPMVYATVGPASEHAGRLLGDLHPGERVLIINRSEANRRALFAVLEPSTLRKLHQHLEVIEESFAERDAPI